MSVRTSHQQLASCLSTIHSKHTLTLSYSLLLPLTYANVHNAPLFGRCTNKQNSTFTLCTQQGFPFPLCDKFTGGAVLRQCARLPLPTWHAYQVQDPTVPHQQTAHAKALELENEGGCVGKFSLV